MTVFYCTSSDLGDYILQGYLDKVEEIDPGSIDRILKKVCAEAREACLQGGYEPSEPGTSSALLKRVCAVITSYRSVSKITSLVDTEASSGNEWLPLQKQFNQAQKDLDKIREGKLNPWPETEASGISVCAPSPMFGPDRWEQF